MGEIDLAATTPAAAISAKPEAGFGLAHWMERVLKECDLAAVDFAPDPVHDLRVALRRCRSMADGLMVIDPSPAWKRMKKAGKQLFSALGELRDSQVLTEWVEKLAAPDDPVGIALAAFAAGREKELKQRAQATLAAFDRKEWLEWTATLPQRAARVKPGSVVFLHMALERWTEAHELHRLAIRNRSNVSFHRLRIGLKRLRYTVENFVPQLHDAWIGDLKHLQDLLGEVHDLDILWATALTTHAFGSDESRLQWREKIQEERTRRIEKYRNKMLGRDSLWHIWRKELPQGDDVKAAALARLRLWASFLDPDVRHTQRITRLALQLFDGMERAGFLRRNTPGLRDLLETAALLHDVGRAKREKNHHKASTKMVLQMRPPLGWEAADLQLAGIAARYHRGVLPDPKQKNFARLRGARIRQALLLGGILRLADALDSSHNGHVQRLSVERQGDCVLVHADGYSGEGESGERVAKARFLLEFVCGTAILVRPAQPLLVPKRVPSR